MLWILVKNSNINALTYHHFDVLCYLTITPNFQHKYWYLIFDKHCNVYNLLSGHEKNVYRHFLLTHVLANASKKVKTNRYKIELQICFYLNKKKIKI